MTQGGENFELPELFGFVSFFDAEIGLYVFRDIGVVQFLGFISDDGGAVLFFGVELGAVFLRDGLELDFLFGDGVDDVV